MKPLKILHTESSKGWGGQENRTLKEALILAPRGHQFYFAASPGAQLLKRAGDAGFQTFEIPMRKSFDLPGMWRLKTLMDEIQPDIVNTHSSHDTILAGVAARLADKRPLLIRTRHLILPITSKLTYSTLPDHVLVTSDATKTALIEQGVDGQRITSIPTGFDETVFDPAVQPKDILRKELNIGPEVPLIGTIAILRHKKGHRYLIDAVPAILKRFPTAQFVFIGDGPQTEALDTLIKERGLSDHIHLLGLRTVAEVLPSLDLMVLPTLEEALGNAFIESAAMGVPVIGTRVGGVPQAVNEGVTGLLIPPEDANAISDAVIALLSDPIRRQQMAAVSRQWACEHFTMSVMGDKLLTCYQRLFTERS